MLRIHLLSIWSIAILFLLCFVGKRPCNGAAVMSVDLGSEWMKIGVVSPGVPMEIALNKESKRKTPAVIAFRDGERTIGEDAQSVGVKFPANAYYYLLDLLGKEVDNPIVDLYRKRFPYYDIVPDEVRNTVVFKNGEEKYSVEELVAQLLVTAREYAEDSTAQVITECVLIVPGYFGQAERAALLTAAQLANIKVLQLINDYTAVALNFGVFRRTDMNETAQYFIFYDMGAQKTSAAVVSYQLLKEKGTREINPVIQVLGVGYDRTLGGLEIQLRLRDFLAEAFNKMGKTKTNVMKNPRAMAKLFKEAGRLKNVLSANADHYAQIENLIEDHDFKLQVTRDELQELCADIWPRVQKPLEQALKMSGLSLDVISQVIVIGGGTRVPKVQEILRDAINQELGKNLNADEAAAMGAVYKAADLATGFKVKKFIIKDTVLFPIQVVFQREHAEGTTAKDVKRTLFGHMNTYPQKKVITFNKHSHDFDFYVNYADLGHLDPKEVSYIGKLNLSHVELSRIAEIYKQHKTENVESKGIKAHFVLDDSGLFELTMVDFVFEKQKVGDDLDEESTLSKLGSTISKLFSGDTEPAEEKKDETVEKTNGTSTDDDDEKAKEGNKNENVNGTQTTTESPTGSDGSKNDTVKIVTVKEPVEHKVTSLFVPALSGETYDKISKRLDDLNSADKARKRRESALNALESFVIEAQVRLGDEEYASCATKEESEKILAECTAVSEWLYEDGEGADAETYEKKLNDLKPLTNDVYGRHWEHEERPEAIKALNNLLDAAKKFLNTAKNYTKDNEEKDVFTQVEIDTLQRTIDDVTEWKNVEIKAQNKLKRSDEVRLTIKAMAEKMKLLDREVKYLVNKMKYWKPKKPAKTSKNDTDEKTVDDELKNNDNKTTTTTTTTTTNDGDDDEAKIEIVDDNLQNQLPEAQEEKPEILELDTESKTEKVKKDKNKMKDNDNKEEKDDDIENHVEL